MGSVCCKINSAYGVTMESLETYGPKMKASFKWIFWFFAVLYLFMITVETFLPGKLQTLRAILYVPVLGLLWFWFVRVRHYWRTKSFDRVVVIISYLILFSDSMKMLRTYQAKWIIIYLSLSIAVSVILWFKPSILDFSFRRKPNLD